MENNCLIDEVQELVWALVDEQATEEHVDRLEQLLLDSDEARRTYVTCMQLHADLYYLLGGFRPRLPAVVEKAIQSQRKKRAAPPMPTFPGTAINLQIPDAFA